MKMLHVTLIIIPLLLFVDSLQAGTGSGLVVGWGDNMSGEATGIPTENSPGIPNHSVGVVSITGNVLSNIFAITAGYGRGLALNSDGAVFGWGANFAGKAVGYETDYPYRANGAVKIDGQVLNKVTAIAAGRNHSLALRSGGTVIAWGGNNNGEKMTLPDGLRDVVAIAAGEDFSLALKRDGTITGWGVRNVPAGLSNVVAIAANEGQSIALKQDGTVVEWSPGTEYENGNVVASNAVAITTGPRHSLALRKDGTVFGWGSNGSGGATGIPTTTGNYQSNGVVTIDGQVLSNVTAIAAGSWFSIALKKDGTVVAWGRRDMGLHPATVPPGLSNVVAIAAAGNFCLAITTNMDVRNLSAPPVQKK